MSAHDWLALAETVIRMVTLFICGYVVGRNWGRINGR